MHLYYFLILSILFTISTTTRADTALVKLTEVNEVKSPLFKTKKHLDVFHRFWFNTTDAFKGHNLYYQSAAFGSTLLLSSSGVDRNVQDYFQKDPIGKDFGSAAIIAGYVWQPLVGGLLYYSDDAKTKTAGSAVLQAGLIQAGYVTLLKGLTGRPDPIKNGDPANKQDGACGNSSDATAFFNITKGCTWPSGHSSSAFSLVSTLYAFYPEKPWIAYFGYPAALAIGVGMVEADEHWFSDVVAGAFIGHVIGWTVGSNFRKDFRRLNSDSPYSVKKRHYITPVLSANGVGFMYQFTY